MRMSRFVAGALLACAAASVVPPAHAQMPESYRESQMRMLRLQRRMLLSMVDSMPERLYRDRATPAQRDFAQQIAHAAQPIGMFLPRLMNAPQPPAAVMDTTAGYGSRAGLRTLVTAAFDYAEGVLQSQSAADRDVVVNMFGNQLPRWQVWDELHQHTIWTAGQIVANFRKHGMAPPGFGFF